MIGTTLAWSAARLHATPRRFEWCSGRIVDFLPHDGDATADADGKVDGDAPLHAKHGARVYRERAGLAADAEVTYTGMTWSAADYGAGSELTFGAEGAAPATDVVVGEDDYDLTVLFELGGERVVTLCAGAEG